MRVPERLEPLLERGIIDDVIQPLQSGKEAAVYVVVADGEHRVAKVYKESENRSFKHRSAYAEGRKVRNSRQQRAMSKKSRYGREELEAAWRDAEVDAIYRCRAAGVRVPEPHAYVDGVLVMEMVAGPDGGPAPRLVDCSFHPDEARAVFDQVLREVVKMLCAGVVHGDLSDFNVLMGRDGPVVIDFPQWLDAAHNRNARQMLIRDVDNLQQFLGRYARGLRGRRFGSEMWQLFERNELRPDTVLTGKGAKQSKLEKAAQHKLEALVVPWSPTVRRLPSLRRRRRRAQKGPERRGRSGGRRRWKAPRPRREPSRPARLRRASTSTTWTRCCWPRTSPRTSAAPLRRSAVSSAADHPVACDRSTPRREPEFS